MTSQLAASIAGKSLNAKSFPWLSKRLPVFSKYIPDITKTESNNCVIIHCFEENNDKRVIAAITVYFQTL